MRMIWKFPLYLEPGPQVVHAMPADAVVLRFRMQNRIPTLWCMVDPENAPIDRHFQIVGTGHELPNGSRYIGMAEDGPYVWHALELGTSQLTQEGQSK